MTIETKYNIGDEVWVIAENEVQRLRIKEVTASASSATRSEDGRFEVLKFRIVYHFKNGEQVSESRCFPTKEELLKSL
jgi:hypothetical protein